MPDALISLADAGEQTNGWDALMFLGFFAFLGFVAWVVFHD
jgi:hypothetical protein